MDKILCYDEEQYLNNCDEKFDLIFDNAYSGNLEHYEKYNGFLKSDNGLDVVVNGTMKERIFGGLQVLLGKRFNIEKKQFHYSFGSMSYEYLDIAKKMMEENKLKFFY